MAAKKIKRLGLAIAVNHVHLVCLDLPAQSVAGSDHEHGSSRVTSKNAFERFPERRKRTGVHELWGSGYPVESLGR